MNRSRLVKPNTWQMSTNFKCHCLAFMFVFALKHTHSLRNVRKYMELSWSKTNNTIDKTAVSITQRIILKLVFLQSRYYLHFDRMKWKRDKKKKHWKKRKKKQNSHQKNGILLRFDECLVIFYVYFFFFGELNLPILKRKFAQLVLNFERKNRQFF